MQIHFCFVASILAYTTFYKYIWLVLNNTCPFYSIFGSILSKQYFVQRQFSLHLDWLIGIWLVIYIFFITNSAFVNFVCYNLIAFGLVDWKTNEELSLTSWHICLDGFSFPEVEANQCLSVICKLFMTQIVFPWLSLYNHGPNFPKLFLTLNKFLCCQCTWIYTAVQVKQLFVMSLL